MMIDACDCDSKNEPQTAKDRNAYEAEIREVVVIGGWPESLANYFISVNASYRSVVKTLVAAINARQ